MTTLAAPVIKWVKLKQFCQLTGLTENAVHKKRQNGKWIPNSDKASYTFTGKY